MFDLDWRPSLWDEPGAYPELAREASALADVVVGNREEVAAAGGLDALLELAPTVILKRGGDGAVLYDDGEIVDVAGRPGRRGQRPRRRRCVRRRARLRDRARASACARGSSSGNRAGAFVAQRVPCSEAMPRLEDLQEVGVS